MDKAFEEATQPNATARDKVVAFLNSMILNPLPFSSNSSFPKVAKHTSSLPSEATADVSKDTSTVPRNAGEAWSNEHLQLSLDPPVAHDTGSQSSAESLAW